VGRRLLVTGAGTGATANLVRSLRAGDAGHVVIGCHSDRFTLATAAALDARYLTPRPSDPAFVPALARLCADERIDLVLPTSDEEVRALSDHRETLAGRVFLPERAVIDRCQDKYALTAALTAAGVPAPATVALGGVDDVPGAFAALGPGRPLWCRARHGTRSLGAAPVRTPEQARAWIEYWEDMRGVPAADFTLSEYLPGRDFLYMGVWRDGVPVLARTFERLAYFGGENSPSGASSLCALARTVRDVGLVDVGAAAVRALDTRASGAFSIDLKEDRRGVRCVTEVNAGRFFIGMTAFDAVARPRMADVLVRVALGEPVEPGEEGGQDECYLVRDLDTLPGLVHAGDLFSGLTEIVP
jgi:carbamoyl-phosphate synthase large subunit